MNDRTLTDIITVLDGFPLTPEQYVMDDGITLTRQAVSRVRDALPELGTEPIGNMVNLLLRARCLSLMSQGVSWERLPGGKGSSLISCSIGGRQFRGKTVIRPKEVRVEMLAGGRRLSGTCTLHKWSPEVFTSEPFVGGEPNSEGLRCAKELFLELCYKELALR